MNVGEYRRRERESKGSLRKSLRSVVWVKEKEKERGETDRYEKWNERKREIETTQKGMVSEKVMVEWRGRQKIFANMKDNPSYGERRREKD